ncbi:MAG: hypothetical protein ACOY5Y_15645 [Pseudomonadota bacterium]
MSLAIHPTAQPPREAEVRAHERTYGRFLVLVRYGVLAHLVAGTFIVLAFFTEASVWVAALAAAAILALGLRSIRRIETPADTTKALELTLTTVLEEGGPAAAAWPEGRERPAADAAPAHPEPASYGTAERVTVGVLYLLVVGFWATLAIPSFLGILGSALG